MSFFVTGGTLQSDARVFGFMLAASVFSALLFGLAPAVQATRSNVMQAARGEFTTDFRPARLRDALVIGQVTVSVLLLICAAVLLRANNRLQGLDVGLQTRGLVAIEIKDSFRGRMNQDLASDPGVQAIANTTADLPPVPREHPAVGRDYEYKRMGTCSILAGLDLQDGHVCACVERKHRSREFVGLLKEIDAYCPPEATVRLLLDNHSAHISKETRAYLATRPNRFVYVHTPKHGSWLNLVETLFGKMSRTFLKGIRVQSWEELRQRILLGIGEINAAPVVHR
jgi:hypothetical protein